MKKNKYRDGITIAFILGLAWGAAMVGYLATDAAPLLGLALVISAGYAVWATYSTGEITDG